MAKSKGPQLNVRFENRKQLERIKRAAKILGQSANTFTVRQVLDAADHLITQSEQSAKPSAIAV